jgi:autoaggregation protein RapA/B/C
MLEQNFRREVEMANYKPIAADVYQPIFDIDKPVDGNILDGSKDADGDPLRLNFVNGQRIPQPANPDGPATTTAIEGKYGTLTIYSDRY